MATLRPPSEASAGGCPHVVVKRLEGRVPGIRSHEEGNGGQPPQRPGGVTTLRRHPMSRRNRSFDLWGFRVTTSVRPATTVMLGPSGASSSHTERSSGAVRALLLSPIVVLIASAARVLIISNYNTTTATTLAASAGVVSTVLGTIVPVLPLFLPPLLVVLVVFRRWAYVLLTAVATALISPAYTPSVLDTLRKAADSGQEIWQRLNFGPKLFTENNIVEKVINGVSDIVVTIGNWLRVVGISLVDFIWPGLDGAELSLVWNEWMWVLISALAAFVLVLIDPPRILRAAPASGDVTVWEKIHGWALWRLIGKAIYALLIAVACAYTAICVYAIYEVPFNTSVTSDILRRPWLPAEQVQLYSGDVLVGYTLSTQDGWHALLEEQTRLITYIPSRNVAARTVCDVKTIASLPSPLISLQGTAPNSVPTCQAR